MNEGGFLYQEVFCVHAFSQIVGCVVVMNGSVDAVHLTGFCRLWVSLARFSGWFWGLSYVIQFHG